MEGISEGLTSIDVFCERRKYIPTSGKNLVIVADVKGVLHFRSFDADGRVIVDTDETICR